LKERRDSFVPGILTSSDLRKDLCGLKNSWREKGILNTLSFYLRRGHFRPKLRQKMGWEISEQFTTVFFMAFSNDEKYIIWRNIFSLPFSIYAFIGRIECRYSMKKYILWHSIKLGHESNFLFHQKIKEKHVFMLRIKFSEKRSSLFN